jgi:hypothetical protein
VGVLGGGEWSRGEGEGEGGHTEFPAPNFFSVPMTVPLLWAALRADLPLTTVSRAAPPPRVLLPIFVTVSQSSMVAIGICLSVKLGSGEVWFRNKGVFVVREEVVCGCGGL